MTVYRSTLDTGSEQFAANRAAMHGVEMNVIGDERHSVGRRTAL